MRSALVIFLAAMVVILGCAAAKIKELHPGMTPEQVEELLGRPDGYQNTAGWETYTYHNLSDVGRSVKSVEGEAGRFTVKLTKAPRYVDLMRCTGCGDCASVCPITVPSDFNENLNDRKATFRHFPQAIPSGYAIDKLGTSPCKAACPTHISVQGYVALIAVGKYKETLKLIKQENPFPSVCGRVCNHPCEEACMRGQVEQPIDIMHLKRFVADLDLNDATKYVPEIKEKKGKKVAVVGAGPRACPAPTTWRSRATTSPSTRRPPSPAAG